MAFKEIVFIANLVNMDNWFSSIDHRTTIVIVAIIGWEDSFFAAIITVKQSRPINVSHTS